MQNFKSKITKFISIMSLVTLVSLITVGCSNKQNSAKQSDKISIVTTTNVYSDIAKNIVGKYGTATAIIDKKPVLVGEDLMGLKSGDNPHIWYNLDMPTKYVDYLVKRLSKLDKKHAAYFKENGEKYLAKIDKIKQLAQANKGDQKPVFVSEPVFDYALQEAGYKIGDKKFEEAIENGTDPSPKTINEMNNAIKQKKIAFFVNNTQASSSTVKSFVKLAKKNNVPVLNVRETIPNNTTYLAWMKENYQKLADIQNN